MASQLRGSAATTSVQERQRVLRLLVKDVLIGPEKITIRHRIPVREPASGGGHHDPTDTEGDMRQSYALCWGRDHSALWCSLLGRSVPALVDHTGFQPGPDLFPGGERPDPAQKKVVVDPVERGLHIGVENPLSLRVLPGESLVVIPHLLHERLDI